MKKPFTLIVKFDQTPKRLYEAWLDSELHTAMTGAEASCSNEVGGVFSAWNGYIKGKNKSLIPNKEIVQAWRTTDFSEADEDSILMVRFNEHPDGCQLELIHQNIPKVDADFESGWKKYYFEPMQKFFRAD